MALYSRAMQSSMLTLKRTHTQLIVKHHIVNPLIAPHVNPFCPVSLEKCQCFLLALITVLVSLGKSVTPSQFPPVSECPLQSRS
ncbi:unnamed protein product, partial [Staurois parvus]